MKGLACIALWGLLAVFSCVSCVEGVLPGAGKAPAAENALGEPIAGPPVPEHAVIRQVGASTWTNKSDPEDRPGRPGSLSFVGSYTSSWEFYSPPAPVEHRTFKQPLCRGVSLANSAHAGGAVVCGSETAVIAEQRVRRRGRVVTATDVVLQIGDREAMRIEGRDHEHDPSDTRRVW